MNTTKTRRSPGRRFLDFIDAFDNSPSDYMFAQTEHAAAKITELEQRLAKLEGPQVVLHEVRRQKAV